MNEYEIEGINVRFPFEPYDVQTSYMAKVLQCLKEEQNGILESPTGTGKTLCLLCSSLAWLEVKKAQCSAMRLAQNQDNSQVLANLTPELFAKGGAAWTPRTAVPKIIYSSRTHSQLSQAISEFKRTTYNHFKMAVIGSRDQLCVHPEVAKETNSKVKLTMCQVRVKARNCYYHSQVENKKDDGEVRKAPLDIEDLVKLGKKKSFCPYFMSRELKQDADIIFMPYNYLLDPTTRKAHGIELAGNIVIFDEAHNVEKMCEEAASLQIRSTDIALAIDEVTQVMKKLAEMAEGSDFAANEETEEVPQDFTVNDLYILKTVFLELEKVIDDIPLPSTSEMSYPGSYMFELLEKADITHNKKVIIIEILDKLILYLSTNSSSPFQRKGAGLQKIQDLIKIVFSRTSHSAEHVEYIKRCYKVHVATEDSQKKFGGNNKDGWTNTKPVAANAKGGKVVSYWCFNPGFGMRDLVDHGAKCLILTSGTLSPLSSFTNELQIPFPIQLENPHIIRPHQVNVSVINKGPDGFTLNSSFQTRNDPKYLNSLGQTILNFSRAISGGLLVFFPSYPILKTCQEFWQNNGVWAKISETKPIYVEPREKYLFQSTMTEYYEKVNDPKLKGACFLAVCRGKVSEGLDFADRNGRAVIITGLPYPPFKDPRIVLKKLYLEETRRIEKKGLTGDAWYKLEASRAVNQAIGRVIRHKDDFGAIMLCDKRFGEPYFRNNLSSWVKPHIKVYDTFGPSVRDLITFFRNAHNSLPQPKLKSGLAAIMPAYEDLNLPPVAANALVVSGCKTVASSARRDVARDDSADDTLKPNRTLASYNRQSSSTIKPKCAFNGDLFSSLEKSCSVIDFNSANEQSKSVNRYDNVFTGNKKKRIKLIDESDRSIDALINNAKGSSQQCSSENQNLFSACSIKKLDETKVGPKKQSSEDKDQDKSSKNSKIAKYLHEVKLNLSSENYKSFSMAIKNYHKDKNYDDLIAILITLFSEPKYHNLFKRFSSFLTADHKKKFEEDLKVVSCK